MDFVYNEGGRAAGGYKGRAGDCVVRAIAIAAQKSYQEVYGAINALAVAESALFPPCKARRRSLKVPLGKIRPEFSVPEHVDRFVRMSVNESFPVIWRQKLPPNVMQLLS
jgi:hypothetical protein